MIDDYDKAMDLMHKMEAQLPIPARPTGTYIRAMRDQGVKVKRSQPLQIKHVLYIGDEGGIMCDVTPSEAKQAQLVSLTHLEINPHHPLAREIRAYQRERSKRLRQSGEPGKPSSFTIRPRKKRRR